MNNTGNKTLPGVYVDFISSRPLTIQVGSQGTVLLPMALDWGDKGKVTEVVAGDDTRLSLGYSMQEILPLREAMKNADRVLVYKLNGGEKASATLGSGTVTAALPGSRGNALSLQVTGEEAPFVVDTWLDGVLMDSQEISEYSEFQPNGLVEINEAGTPAKALVTLSGGTDEEEQTTDWESFLPSAQTLFFDTMACMSDEESVKEQVVSFVRLMREQEGKKIQAVMANKAADYEGIISVQGGVVLEGDEILPAETVCAYIAGMTAGAAINESCTHHIYQGAVDVTSRMTRAQKEEAVGQGHMILDVDAAGQVYVVYDINTLRSGLQVDFRKNRVLRVLDGIHQDVKSLFEGSYLGKVSNDPNGRSLLRGSLVEYFGKLEQMGAITGFQSDDISVEPGSDSDSVIIGIAVAPVDSCEKFYITVQVNQEV
ncbi:MAG: phage tail sheath family protein [Eubacteriales bacterium]